MQLTARTEKKLCRTLKGASRDPEMLPSNCLISLRAFYKPSLSKTALPDALHLPWQIGIGKVVLPFVSKQLSGRKEQKRTNRDQPCDKEHLRKKISNQITWG